MIKLETFLKRIDSAASKMSAVQLRSFVHEIARSCPENRRYYLLNAIKSVASSEQQAETIDDFEHIKKMLKKINDGVLCLDSVYNDDWDDSCDEDTEPIIFSDPGKLVSDIKKAMEFIHTCIAKKLYAEAYQIVEILLDMNITANGDYEDYLGSPLKIVELNVYGLLDNSSFRKFVKDALILTYINNKLPDRIEKLCSVIANCGCHDIKLEEIMKYLPDFKEFLPLWVEYLSSHENPITMRLLTNAQLLLEKLRREEK